MAGHTRRGPFVHNSTPTYDNAAWFTSLDMQAFLFAKGFACPEDFGAVGDGNQANATADTAGIQGALNAAPGKKIVLLTGWYRINGSINVPDNSIIMGASGRSPDIFAGGSTTRPLMHGTDGYTGDFFVPPAGGGGFEFCEWRNIMFQGNARSFIRSTTGMAWCRVEGCAFRSCTDSAIYKTGGTNSANAFVLNFTSNTVTSPGTLSDYRGSFHIDGSDNFFYMNELGTAEAFDTATEEGLTCGLWTSGGSNWIVSNVAEACHVGYVNDGADYIAFNRADNHQQEGFIIRNWSPCKVIGNEAHKCSMLTNGGYPGFRVTGNGVRFAFNGTGSFGLTNKPSYGVIDSSNGSTDLNANVYFANKFPDTVSGDYSFTNGASNAQAFEGRGKDFELIRGNGGGLITRAPNGTRYRISVNDAGSVIATAL